MTCRLAALVLALPFLAGAPACAMETPSGSARDSRIRTVAYDPNQVVKLYAVPGSTLTIQLAAGETVAGLAVSDQSLLDPPREEAPASPLALAGGGAAPRNGPVADRNLLTAVRGNFVMLKPLRELDPQPLFIIGRSTDPATGRETMRAYTFELSTRAGPLTEGTPDTYYLVRFAYPAEERAAAVAAASARRQAAAARAAEARAQREAQAARDRLATAAAPAAANWRYDGQGDRGLAPSETWDDGQSTFLRFPGNRRIPAIFAVLPDGREAAVNYSASADGLVTVHGVLAALRLRDGNRVLCIFNRAYDPTGRNPGTGTTRADVVREVRP
ncbi:TrbG/VirB9 family P-type conjugative transfer protein [Roseomonas sp. NAR14]|uniref:TrbG/VirB9 family P-type conjugative transfer protein n=1 Tax=Roseomonas acroporae TaxID=2937791 RepID=A0A9X1YBA6_9PROT|nr:TrbG/VirB9 family P-type conjugative transfer protein [Roseomonas acroporae]